MKKLRWAALSLCLVSALAACGSSTQPQLSEPNQAKSPIPISGQLVGKEEYYQAQGYKKLSDYAYIREKADGEISTVVEGKVGQMTIMTYLKDVKNGLDQQILTLRTQSVDSSEVKNSEQKLENLKNIILSLETAYQSSVKSDETSKTDPSKVSSQAEPYCSIDWATASAGASPGQYAYANANIGDFNYPGCYSSRWQVDAGYPRVSKSATIYSNGSCSGNGCPYVRGQATGYPSGGSCYSFAFVELKGNLVASPVSKSSSGNC